MTNAASGPPPLLPESRLRLGGLHPVWLALGVVALAFAAKLMLLWQLPWPQCLLRKFTGVPCLTCGCTRSLAAWTRLDFAAALRFNPLFFLLCLVLLAWLAAQIAQRLTGRSWMPAWIERTQSRRLWWIMGLLAAANWVYLILTLPR